MNKQHHKTWSAYLLSAMLLICTIPARAETTSVASIPLIESNKVIKQYHCVAQPLQQALLDLGRQAGFSALVDEDLQDRKLSADYNDMSINQILDDIQKQCNIKFETIAPGTIVATAKGSPVEATTTSHNPEIAPAGPISNALPSMESGMPLEAQGPEQKETKKSIRLQGGIEHRESLSAVSSDLRAGAQISVGRMKAMQSLVPDNIWSRLPNWAAGSWKTQSQTAYYRYSYRYKSKDFDVNTFMNKSAETLGHQRDKKGDLWTWDRAHYWTLSEGEQDYSLTFHRDIETIYKDEKQFTIHFISTRLIVDKSTKHIRRTVQLEAIQTYSSPENNIIRCKSSIKEFDQDGLPVLLQKSISYKFKIAKYEPWNSDRGENLRVLFSQYLTMHGLKDLIPN